MKQIFFTFGLFLLISLLFCVNILYSQNTLREHGIKTGIFNTGKYNAITDVPGVSVGQVTCIQGEDIRTGVTAIIPHQGNIFRKKV
ncbi:MAG: P1 family peptidase, partial [Bacteroidales bacterium]